jgi:diaminopimelate decarboxylase
MHASPFRGGSALAHRLIRRFGSPLYVYEWEVIRRRWSMFVEAFPYRPTSVHYAVVCNKAPGLVSRLAGLGAGVHANTPGDLHAALVAGVPTTNIVYSGTNLDADDLRYVIANDVRCNLDSLDQVRDYVELGGRLDVGLRILVDPSRSGRIGITEGEVPTAVAIAAAKGVRVTGLHMYAGTNTRRSERFLSCFDRLIGVSDLVPDLEELDAGGGFGIPYVEGQGPLDLQRLGRELSSRMGALSARRGRRVRLVLEPGRFIVGSSGSLLMTVVSVKQRAGVRFVGVDTTVGNVVVPDVYHVRHRLAAVQPRGPNLDLPTDVCGNTTHSRDFIGRDMRLPSLEPGDLLVLGDVGAYGYAMSSHFLNRPRPAEVLIDGPDVHLMTRRETFDDLMATHLQGSFP